MDLESSPVVQAIESALQTVASAGEQLDPALAPMIVLGQAVAAAVPSLVDDVANLIGGAAPTPADTAALAAKIQALANPAAL